MSQTQANLVEVRGIRFSRGDRVIFDDISLSVPRGKITAIMGPSGIGKTTLLRLIGGQIPPDRGEILFDGENVPQMTRSRLYTVRKRMSMLFQSGALFTDLNVFDARAYAAAACAAAYDGDDEAGSGGVAWGGEVNALRAFRRDGAPRRPGESDCP